MNTKNSEIPPASEKQIGGMLGTLASMTGGDESRKVFLRWAFDVDSANDLTPANIAMLRRWISIRKDDTGSWVPDGDALTEAQNVIEYIAESEL